MFGSWVMTVIVLLTDISGATLEAKLVVSPVYSSYDQCRADGPVKAAWFAVDVFSGRIPLPAQLTRGTFTIKTHCTYTRNEIV